jgi:hypothetical protein
VSCWRARQFTFARGDIVVFVSPKVTAVMAAVGFDFLAGVRNSIIIELEKIFKVG